MLFQDGGDVPLQITPQERLFKKSIQCDDPQLKDKAKAELLVSLKSSGGDIYVAKGKRVGYLQDIAHTN